MTVDEWARPEPAADWVAIRPEAAGICGSEVEGYVGRQPNRRPPLVMGHEFAGVVVEAGGERRAPALAGPPGGRHPDSLVPILPSLRQRPAQPLSPAPPDRRA